ncbi:MAG: glyoxalase [Pseudomonadales bacterium]|nr:glyoxalase [Pseudomonadales bacterium]
MKIGYVNVFVSDIEQSKRFFEDSIGLTCQVADASHGYASFNAGPISFGAAQTDDADKIGRLTGIGFIVDDIDQTYNELLAKGVEFEMPPTAQPWGGVLALFKDPDGNVFYLDPGMPH